MTKQTFAISRDGKTIRQLKPGDVLADGEKLHVGPMMLQDNRTLADDREQQALLDRAEGARDGAHAVYVDSIGNGWRGDHTPAAVTGVADAESAYKAYVASITDGWKQPA